jgi:hypothetical protein
MALFMAKFHAYLSISVTSLGNLSLNTSIIGDSNSYQYCNLSSVNYYFTNIINLTLLVDYDAHIRKFENWYRIILPYANIPPALSTVTC